MYNHRISVFICEGVYLTSFRTKFNYPGGIAIDRNHDVVVSDSEKQSSPMLLKFKTDSYTDQHLYTCSLITKNITQVCYVFF